MTNWKILETAKAAPIKVVTNTDLSHLMDTSDEWIKTRTGILRRHISNGENTSDLASTVAKQLLAKSGIKAEKVDLIIVATMSPDSYTPSTAAIVQGKIGASNAIAFDISAACTGFVYALSVAESMLGDRFRNAIVIGSEVLSKIIDWQDRASAVLFGDGAGGVLITKTDQPTVLGQALATFGTQSQQITAGKTSVIKAFPRPVTQVSPFVMNGRAVYKFATHQVPISIRQAASQAGIGLEQIDCFILHQANARIIRQVARRLHQPITKFPININEYGNTSAASEPILLAECVAKGVIHRGDLIALSGFGGGLTTGTIIIKY